MSLSFSRFFSRAPQFFVATALVVFASLAFALPTPKDIEAAVEAGHLTQAESMLREVIYEKPQSAKAYYELGQVLAREGRYPDAEVALRQAKKFDPSLKFAGSPEKFNQTYDKVSALAATPAPAVTHKPGATPVVVDSATPATSGGASLTYVWLAIGGLVVLGIALRKRIPAPMTAPAAYAPVSEPPRGFGAQYSPNYQGGVAPYGAAPVNTGSTMTGAVVGGLAGVAAGYALSKALEGEHGSSGHVKGSDSTGYVPLDTPAAPPADFGSFDAGSGSDWGDADSSSSSDSDW